MEMCFHQGLQEKLKETEEAQKVMQKDCETYKKVLAETVRERRSFKGRKDIWGK